MKQCHRRSILAWTSAGGFCLLVACTPATVDESAGNAEVADKAASASVPAEEQAVAQPHDIIDRIFSPLDKAVSDVNRDLNKDDAGSSSETNE
ncbi:MAG: hypothetical protein PVH54_10970 [Gammaproteobacteria bacterium]|jgi:hypothetical protein